ncbi:MAG: DEAD/DEAH box helicase family protein [Planctomycetes bacterium]|nr:DEAD/DEAH box helicase family protein [Planctomycetota bacterium]
MRPGDSFDSGNGYFRADDAVKALFTASRKNCGYATNIFAPAARFLPDGVTLNRRGKVRPYSRVVWTKETPPRRLLRNVGAVFLDLDVKGRRRDCGGWIIERGVLLKRPDGFTLLTPEDVSSELVQQYFTIGGRLHPHRLHRSGEGMHGAALIAAPPFASDEEHERCHRTWVGIQIAAQIELGRLGFGLDVFEETNHNLRCPYTWHRKWNKEAREWMPIRPCMPVFIGEHPRYTLEELEHVIDDVLPVGWRDQIPSKRPAAKTPKGSKRVRVDRPKSDSGHRLKWAVNADGSRRMIDGRPVLEMPRGSRREGMTPLQELDLAISIEEVIELAGYVNTGGDSYARAGGNDIRDASIWNGKFHIWARNTEPFVQGKTYSAIEVLALVLRPDLPLQGEEDASGRWKRGAIECLARLARDRGFGSETKQQQELRRQVDDGEIEICLPIAAEQVHAAANIDAARETFSKIGTEFFRGGDSVYLEAEPGSGKTSAIVCAAIQSLYANSVSAVVVALPTRAAVQEKVAAARNLVECEYPGVRAEVYLGRTPDRKSVGYCEDFSAQTIRASLGHESCRGCPFVERCGEEPERYRHWRSTFNFQAASTIFFTTAAALPSLLEELRVAPRIVSDDTGPDTRGPAAWVIAKPVSLTAARAAFDAIESWRHGDDGSARATLEHFVRRREEEFAAGSALFRECISGVVGDGDEQRTVSLVEQRYFREQALGLARRRGEEAVQGVEAALSELWHRRGTQWVVRRMDLRRAKRELLRRCMREVVADLGTSWIISRVLAGLRTPFNVADLGDRSSIGLEGGFELQMRELLQGLPRAVRRELREHRIKPPFETKQSPSGKVRAVSSGWPWERIDEIDGEGAAERPALSSWLLDMLALHLERRIPPRVRPEFKDSERGKTRWVGWQIEFPNVALIRAAKAGRLLRIGVEPLPAVIARATGLQRHRVELVVPNQRVAAVQLEVQTVETRLGAVVRCHSLGPTKKPDLPSLDRGDELVRSLVLVVARGLCSGTPYTIDGQVVRRVVAVVRKDDEAALLQHEEVCRAIRENRLAIATYGKNHASLDCFADAELLICRRQALPARGAESQAESFRRALEIEKPEGGGPSSSGASKERHLLRWDGTETPWIVAGLPPDPLAREIELAYGAYFLRNAVGRTRAAATSAKRTAIVLDGRPVTGLRITEIVQGAEAVFQLLELPPASSADAAAVGASEHEVEHKRDLACQERLRARLLAGSFAGLDEEARLLECTPRQVRDLLRKLDLEQISADGMISILRGPIEAIGGAIGTGPGQRISFSQKSRAALEKTLLGGRALLTDYMPSKAEFERRVRTLAGSRSRLAPSASTTGRAYVAIRGWLLGEQDVPIARDPRTIQSRGWAAAAFAEVLVELAKGRGGSRARDPEVGKS